MLKSRKTGEKQFLINERQFSTEGRQFFSVNKRRVIACEEVYLPYCGLSLRISSCGEAVLFKQIC